MEKDKKDKLKGIICQDCLSSADQDGFTPYIFHWVSMEAGYQGLFCEKCIEKYNLIPISCYSKKPGRKKGIKNKKIDN